MKLHRAYNTSYVQFLRWIYNAFQSPGLKNEIECVEKVLADDAESVELFRTFSKEIEPFEDELFNSDDTNLSKVGLFKRIELPAMWETMADDEKAAFFKNVVSLIRYGSMLKACGTQIGSMEEMAMNFMKANPDVKPEEYQQKVFQEMLSGGEMSKHLINTFKKPGTLEAVLGNFATLLRTPGKDPIDLSAVVDMVKSEDIENLDKDFEELRTTIKDSGINPFENVQTGTGTDLNELMGSLSSSDVMNAINAIPHADDVKSDEKTNGRAS